MQTRSSSRLVSNPSSNPTPSTNPNLKGRNRRRSKQRIENFNLEEHSPPIVTMADQQDLHAHVRYFNKITSTLKFPNVSNTSIKLMIFPFSLEGAAQIWLEKEPPRLIFTWDDLVLKFINQFFPSSKTTNLRNEITNFHQRVMKSPISINVLMNLLVKLVIDSKIFFEPVPIMVSRNYTNLIDSKIFFSAAGGNFLDKMPRECLAIIESKSKVRYSHNKPVIAKVSTNTSTSSISPDVVELKDMVKALLLDKKSQNQSAAPVKAVKESCVTCGAPAPQTQGVSKEDFLAYIKANDAVMRNMQTQGQNMQNQLTNLTDLITMFVNSNSGSTLSSGTLPSNTIANPRSDLKAITTRSGVSYVGPQILPPPSFLPKVVENELDTTKDTMNPTNNESTEDVQPQVVQSESPILTSKPITSPISEPVIAPVLLKKLPENLGDPGKFLIPYDFPGMAECLALADLDASINLMPFLVWKRISLRDLTPTFMTLEQADRSISHPVGVAEDLYVKVGSFHFSFDFVVVDFDADPPVPLILGRSFLKIGKALIDVFEGEITLRVGFYDTISSGNPTPFYDPIVSTTSLTLTPFGNSDFILEEVDAFLAIEDEPTSSEFYQPYLDSEGDILLLEAFLNDDPSLPPLNQINYLPELRKELKIYEAKSDKSSVDEPLMVKLKDLHPHLEYAFLEGDDKLPVIITKDLSVEEKAALITVLKSHKRAITWKLSDIKGIDPEFYTHKILMEEDFEP
nr:reverse transcriptase domain-containing protein [Tanacetum cinerariifolium]